jgi:hypothetical protein
LTPFTLAGFLPENHTNVFTAEVLGSFRSRVFVLELVHLEDVRDPDLLDQELPLDRDDELLPDETDMVKLVVEWVLYKTLVDVPSQ